MAAPVVADVAQLAASGQELVLATCRRVLRDPHDAADAAQEVFCKLIERQGEIRGDALAWLHRCAYTTALDHLRARRRRQDAVAPLREDSGAVPLLPEVPEDIDAALDALPEDERMLLIAHYWQGEDQRQLAQQIGRASCRERV